MSTLKKVKYLQEKQAKKSHTIFILSSSMSIENQKTKNCKLVTHFLNVNTNTTVILLPSDPSHRQGTRSTQHLHKHDAAIKHKTSIKIKTSTSASRWDQCKCKSKNLRFLPVKNYEKPFVPLLLACVKVIHLCPGRNRAYLHIFPTLMK